VRSPALVFFLGILSTDNTDAMFIFVAVLCTVACVAIWRGVFSSAPSAAAKKQKCDEFEFDDADPPPPPPRRQRRDPVLAVFYRPRLDTLVDCVDVYRAMRGPCGDWRGGEEMTVGDVVRTLDGSDGDDDDDDDVLFSVYTLGWYHTGRWRRDQKFWELFSSADNPSK